MDVPRPTSVSVTATAAEYRDAYITVSGTGKLLHMRLAQPSACASTTCKRDRR